MLREHRENYLESSDCSTEEKNDHPKDEEDSAKEASLVFNIARLKHANECEHRSREDKSDGCLNRKQHDGPPLSYLSDSFYIVIFVMSNSCTGRGVVFRVILCTVMSRIIPRSTLIIFFSFAFFVIGAILIFAESSLHATSCSGPALTFPAQTFAVRIADTPDARERGLSGVPRLASSTGMLFLFDESAPREFWMKEMRFPLDIVWMDEVWRVVGITRNATPDSFPTRFPSPGPAQYALEVPAGTLVEAVRPGEIARFEPCLSIERE